MKIKKNTSLIAIFCLLLVGFIYRDSFKMVQNYKYLIIYFIALLGICIVIKETKEKNVKNYYILTLIIPILSYISFELITGNLLLIKNPYAIIMNIIFYYFIYGIVIFITGNIAVTACFLGIVFSTIALVNYFLLIYHKRPLMVADLAIWKTATAVISEYDFSLTAHILAGLSVQVFGVVFACLLPNDNIWKKRKLSLIGSGSFGVILAVAIFTNVGSDNRHIQVNMWMPSDAYRDNGFWLCTLYERKLNFEKKPVGYSKKSVEEIESKYSALRSNDENVKPKNEPENIIFIMNEALTDFRVIGNFETNMEVTPFLDKWRDSCIWGNLYVSVWGAYTSNTEYEVLTGNSMALYKNPTIVPYQSYMKSQTPSLAQLLRSNGFNNIAYHPADATNYNRKVAYASMGFDCFYDINSFETETLRAFTTDKSNFDNLKNIIDSKEEKSKLFLFNVTMQNHGGYTVENFESNIKIVDYPEEFPMTEQYLSLLNKTDRAMEEFIKYLSQLDENTVVVMWGDHQPVVENEFYEMLFGKVTDNWTREEIMKRYITPFYVWANYPIETGYVDKISANYLSAFVLDKLGMELSGYQNFLMSLWEELPVFCAGGYYNKEGKLYPIENEGEYEKLIQEYRYLQYNNVFDTKNQLKDFF